MTRKSTYQDLSYTALLFDTILVPSLAFGRYCDALRGLTELTITALLEMVVAEPYRDVLAALLETFFPVLDNEVLGNPSRLKGAAAASLQLSVHRFPELISEVLMESP